MAQDLYSARSKLLLELLVKHRKQAKLTQTHLAERLAKPQSFVAKYERGERRLGVLEFLDVAAAMGVDPASILSELKQTASTSGRALTPKRR